MMVVDVGFLIICIIIMMCFCAWSYFVRVFVFVFFLCLCFAATQLARQLHQERTQVVCSNKEAWKRLSESNGTPVMDFGHMNVVLK
jgi:c-di-AMP phosphodiesterase-like protein